MAIRFNSNQNKAPLENLNINDTFIFNNRIGLVIECEVYDAELVTPVDLTVSIN